MRFHPRQQVRRKIVDAQHPEVTAWRYVCTTCGGTFRVYPQGVSAKQISQRTNGIAVMLYLLGLSYGAVALMLASLGMSIAKSSVYRAVQAVIAKVPGLKKEEVKEGQYKTKAVGADVTSIGCNGVWIPEGIVVDAINGIVIGIDELPWEETEQLKAWLEPFLDAVDADILVTDEADAFKRVSDVTGRAQQVCKGHVGRNTDALVDEFATIIQSGQDHSLAVMGVKPEQALEDLDALKEMIHSRHPEEARLEEIYLRYANTPRPGKNQKHSLAYRMRNLFMDRWNLWPRLCFYRTWKDEHGNEILDGTNNHRERAIGWSIKERYRSMRGYKQERSALGVSRLIAFGGDNLAHGLRLADFIA